MPCSGRSSGFAGHIDLSSATTLVADAVSFAESVHDEIDANQTGDTPDIPADKGVGAESDPELDKIRRLACRFNMLLAYVKCLVTHDDPECQQECVDGVETAYCDCWDAVGA